MKTTKAISLAATIVCALVFSASAQARGGGGHGGGGRGGRSSGGGGGHFSGGAHFGGRFGGGGQFRGGINGRGRFGGTYFAGGYYGGPYDGLGYYNTPYYSYYDNYEYPGDTDAPELPPVPPPPSAFRPSTPQEIRDFMNGMDPDIAAASRTAKAAIEAERGTGRMVQTPYGPVSSVF
jgi:hypothetical protein